MNDRSHSLSVSQRVLLGAILLLFVALSAVGLTWGLPSRDIDDLLSPGEPPWSGERIYSLAGGSGKFSPTRGADVDADPLVGTARGATREPVLLTGSPEGAAAIYLRYRLYTYQPDEMITMMALAGMRPASLDLDPRLYQYGGLFIYPVGALIRLAGALGWIDVRADVPFYLDHPEEFGKFYVVARGSSAAWGLVGVLVVFAIARRLGGVVVGLSAALLFTLEPVVVCMAHEGKPHLPGAVLMLLAVLMAMRHAEGVGRRGVDRPHRRNWWAMCACCGAAFGMVLSSLPVFLLIPLMAVREARRLPSSADVDEGRGHSWVWAAASRTTVGFVLAGAVYLLFNPYIAINAVVNRDVLASNFGNSLAMYELARVGEGLVRVCELTAEGAGAVVAIFGVLAFVVWAFERKGAALPLAVGAGAVFVQFVMLGAGKPAEYARFAVFPGAALAIGAADLLVRPRSAVGEVRRGIAAGLVILATAWSASPYVWNFRTDATDHASRRVLGRELLVEEVGEASQGFAVLAEPAPYAFPPIDFSRREVWWFPSVERFLEDERSGRLQLIAAVDDPRVPLVIESTDAPAARTWRRWPATDHALSPISWANKPFLSLGIGPRTAKGARDGSRGVAAAPARTNGQN